MEKTVEHTIKWYRQQAEGVPSRRLCEADISDFTAA
jgi:hypothetical protein